MYFAVARLKPKILQAPLCETPFSTAMFTTCIPSVFSKPPPLLLVLLHGIDHEGLLAGELFQTPVLVLEFLDLLNLGYSNPAVHSLPAVIRLFAYGVENPWALKGLRF